MKFKLDTNYSEEELQFLAKHNCKIFSEIKLSKINFSENEVPRRLFNYGGTYIAEIVDDETGNLVWAVLSKFFQLIMIAWKHWNKGCKFATDFEMEGSIIILMHLYFL